MAADKKAWQISGAFLQEEAKMLTQIVSRGSFRTARNSMGYQWGHPLKEVLRLF